MDNNKAEKLNKIDELLESTSAENRKKSRIFDDEINEFQETDNNGNEESGKNIEVESVSDNEPKANETKSEPIHIVDETSTVFASDDETEPAVTEIDEDDFIDDDEEEKPKKAKKAKKSKKEKKGKVKFTALQWVILVVCSIITLWVVIFTVDYTLASTGNSPLFSVETQSFEDGSKSYAGAGYKIQFFFENNGTLYKNVMPFWKDGPNDKAVDSEENEQPDNQIQDNGEVSFE